MYLSEGGVMNAHTYTLKPNLDEVNAHLSALFPPAFVHRWPDAQVEVVYGPPGVFTDSRWFSAFEPKTIVDFVEVRSACGDNVYVGAALRHGAFPASGRANAKDNYLAAQYAWCEYDGADDHKRVVATCKKQAPRTCDHRNNRYHPAPQATPVFSHQGRRRYQGAASCG